jgi:hypothetical protein
MGFGFILSAKANQAGPLDPLSIVGGSPSFYLNADVGVSEAGGAGTGVSQWLDQSTGGRTFSQATLGARPVLGVGSLGGRNIISGDGAAKWLTSNFVPGTLAGNPLWIWAVTRQNSWNASSRLWGGQSSTVLKFGGRTSTPNVNIFNGAHGPTVSMTLASWFRLRALYNAATTDYIQLGDAAKATGTNVLNTTAGTAFALFANNDGTGLGDFSIACMLAMRAEPSAGIQDSLKDWALAYYAGLA